MAYKRKKRIEDDEMDPNSWMAIYSDTITLLLTFFILLYSFSVIDNEKLTNISNALQTELTGLPILTEDADKITDVIQPGEQLKDKYDELVDKVNLILTDNELNEIVKVREEANGVALQLDESILFDQGKADLKESSKQILEVISEILPQLDNEIIVQGHADNVPINSQKYGSNWELSTARSVNVLRYFVEEKGFSASRFSATGYGEYRPLVENTTPENKAINRRVDIFIVQKKEKKD